MCRSIQPKRSKREIFKSEQMKKVFFWLFYVIVAETSFPASPSFFRRSAIGGELSCPFSPPDLIRKKTSGGSLPLRSLPFILFLKVCCRLYRCRYLLYSHARYPSGLSCSTDRLWLRRNYCLYTSGVYPLNQL